ncbi:MAG TPA: alpha/beta hydrolase [Cyclobacteriaceae bacterium]|nr:alpha/beta hydrolase [Cyclobacteriaceae bacterium]
MFLTISSLTSCSCNSQNDDCKKDTLKYITTQYGCSYIKVFKSDSITSNPNLLIVIHGDAPFNPPSYQYKLSQRLSEQVSNTIIVSVLRPGYRDSDGNRSDGKRGLTTGDNYTGEVINNLTEVIVQLKNRFKPSKTILAGHSGGAAISADIVSLAPQLVDKLILVSCPCDVEAFRKSMALKQPLYRAWRDSVKSISPIDVIKDLNQNADILLIHGKQDDIVPFKIVETYHEKLKSNSIKVQLMTIENGGHEIFLSETVLSVLRRSLKPISE